MQKVVNSDKQSDETKMEYLSLKKKDIQNEIRNEIHSLYGEFFKGEYERMFGESGEKEFEMKVRAAIDVLRKAMLSRND